LRQEAIDAAQRRSGADDSAPLRPLKNQFFNGTTALCLSAFNLTSGKEHKEIARNGRSVAPDQPAQPEETG